MDWLPEPSWALVVFAYIAGIATVCLLPFVWVWLDRRYFDFNQYDPEAKEQVRRTFRGWRI